MHGLINRAIERFVRDTYGREAWNEVIEPLDLGFSEFEAMLIYDEEITVALLDRMSIVLDRPVPEILEDLGTYLVSHPNVEALRRLLRFGGVNFQEFLHSLDDLPERARLAVSDLALPAIELREHTATSFSLTVRSGPRHLDGFGFVLLGLLRAMADDYGALVFLEHRGGREGTEIVSVDLVETAFAQGRDFSLSAGGAG